MRGIATVPGTQSLLQAIERLVQATNKIRTGAINKTSRLHIINRLVEGAMQESIIDIKLMNRPIMRESNCEHCANGSRLDHGTEGLIKINSKTLSETSKNPTSLLSLKRTISTILMAINPLVGHNIGSRGTRTNSHVLLAINAEYSSVIASLQFGSASALR